MLVVEDRQGAVSKAKSKLIEEGTIKAGKRMKLDKFPQKRAQLYPVKHGNFVSVYIRKGNFYK